MTTNIYSILPDTNIIAYIIATENENPEYRLRAKLINYLIKRNDVVIYLYEEQIHEIRRTIKDLIITGKITGRKLVITKNLLKQIENILYNLEKTGKLKHIPDDDPITMRATELYAALEKYYSGKIKGKISTDLEILAAAEKADATIITRDSKFYKYYKEVLNKRTTTPSMYYLEINKEHKKAKYRLCGQSIEPIETALKQACKEYNVLYEEPIKDC